MEDSLNKISNYYLQIYSPVHIGSGLRLQKGLDFFYDAGRTWLIDKHALEEQLAKNTKALDYFASDVEPNVHKLARDYELNLNGIVATSYAGEVTTRDMFEFVHNGMSIPFIPGSSIKGAIRTAILWKLSQTPHWQNVSPQLLESVMQARNERVADQSMIEQAFNIATAQKRPNDANRNLMRLLHVGDVHFSTNDLELVVARVFNLSSEDHYGWKKMGTPRNESDPFKATPLAAEALRIGAAAEAIITVDEFLLQSVEAQKEANFGHFAEIFHELPDICNKYAARQIDKQRTFFKKYNLTALVNFYDELERERVALPKGDFLLRLSWGSGWQGMTGELIENMEELLRVREKFNLGKFNITGELPEKCPICGSKRMRADRKKPKTGFCFEGIHSFPAPDVKKVMFPVFPKTRKIAFKGRQATYPFGWVVFRQERPDVPPPENRKNLTPPAYKRIIKTYEQRYPTAKGGEVYIPKPKAVKPELIIRAGEKLRAEVINLQGNKYTIRILEKDVGRELNFSRSYLPVKVNDTIEVRIVATNPAGDQITKIDFFKKVTK